MIGFNYGGYGYGHAGLGLLGEIINVVFWVAIIMLIIRLIRGGGWHARHGWKDGMAGMMGGKSAIDLLKERYAKGEIDKAEFETKKKDLSE